MRVFVYEHSDSLSKLITLWLESQPDLEHVGVAHHPETAIARIAATQPDIVVLDAILHSRVSLLPNDVRSVAPAAAIIVYSAHDTLIARRVAPTADAYVLKRGDSHELIPALRAHGSRVPVSLRTRPTGVFEGPPARVALSG